MLKTTEYEAVTQIKMSRYPEFRPGTIHGVFVLAYLADGLLIDSGPAYTAEELGDFLKDKGLQTVVNTHYHEDHIGANALLKERFGVELLAHPNAVDKINQQAILYPYQEEVWGYPLPSKVKEIGDSISTKHLRFDVINTPGHDRDHICLFEKSNGWLFTGDLFVSTRPRVCRSNENIWQTTTDLKKMRDLKPRAMFTATVAKVITDPVDILDQTIQYLEDIGHKIIELKREGFSPVEIRQQIFGEEYYLAKLTQQQFSSLNLVYSFLKKES